MSGLNISKTKAIEILNQRLSDLNKYDIEDKVWCSRTSQDIKIIFNGMDGVTRSHEIEKLTYAITGTWKNTAKGYINSYIDFINDHYQTEIPIIQDNNSLILVQTKQHLTEQIQQNANLLTQLNQAKNQINQFNKLIDDYINTDKAKGKEIERLNESIWQIEGVNLKRLWQVFSNLKLKEQIAILTALGALIALAFLCGQHYTELLNQAKSTK